MEKSFFDAVRRAQLMETSTKYEDEMCRLLKSLGMRFIRQYPIRTPKKVYFADIFLPDRSLVIEMDGAYHFTKDQRRLDSNRTANMRRQGIRVIRFRNSDLKDLRKVLKKLEINL